MDKETLAIDKHKARRIYKRFCQFNDKKNPTEEDWLKRMKLLEELNELGWVTTFCNENGCIIGHSVHIP